MKKTTRKTAVLDDDVVRIIRATMFLEKVTFKQAVNDLIRIGLSAPKSETEALGRSARRRKSTTQ